MFQDWIWVQNLDLTQFDGFGIYVFLISILIFIFALHCFFENIPNDFDCFDFLWLFDSQKNVV